MSDDIMNTKLPRLLRSRSSEYAKGISSFDDGFDAAQRVRKAAKKYWNETRDYARAEATLDLVMKRWLKEFRKDKVGAVDAVETIQLYIEWSRDTLGVSSEMWRNWNAINIVIRHPSILLMPFIIRRFVNQFERLYSAACKLDDARVQYNNWMSKNADRVDVINVMGKMMGKTIKHFEDDSASSKMHTK